MTDTIDNPTITHRDPQQIANALLGDIDERRRTFEQLAHTANQTEELHAKLAETEAEYARLVAAAGGFGVDHAQLRAAGLPVPAGTAPKKAPAKKAPAAKKSMAAKKPAPARPTATPSPAGITADHHSSQEA
ncbi:hypothetical protein [Tsukamurella spumae]|uniref:Uncharacterized protein n=1 Tax=Tsukamurella spumae TaxID=44753 RepID=A0A846X302_9ACTN|nr:hypothetical protein [Tsukamurella spumae]NKY19471.1 hypothetical protein [Tsukamurella spumae]